MIEHFIFALLDADVGVDSLVGNRIYPIMLPQNPTYPCVAYSVTVDKEDVTFDGQGTFQQVSAEIDAWAESHAEILTIGETVKAAMKNYSGTLAGVQVDAIHIESVISVYEDVAKKYRQTLSVTIYKR